MITANTKPLYPHENVVRVVTYTCSSCNKPDPTPRIFVAHEVAREDAEKVHSPTSSGTEMIHRQRARRPDSRPDARPGPQRSICCVPSSFRVPRSSRRPRDRPPSSPSAPAPAPGTSRRYAGATADSMFSRAKLKKRLGGKNRARKSSGHDDDHLRPEPDVAICCSVRPIRNAGKYRADRLGRELGPCPR